MTIARPLSQARAPAGFDTTLSFLRAPDVTFGNLETSIIDIRAMGFNMVGRANNHALD